MRVAVSLSVMAVLLLAVGCGSNSEQVRPTSTSTPALSLAFGGATPPAQDGIGAEQIRIFNYSHVEILDAGWRPLNTSLALQNPLSGLTELHRRSVLSAELEWVTLPTGGYEFVIVTSEGEVTATGYIGAIELPDGSYAAQPTDLYLFGFDYVPADHPANPRDGPLPPTPGNPVQPGGGGGVLPGGN